MAGIRPSWSNFGVKTGPDSSSCLVPGDGKDIVCQGYLDKKKAAGITPGGLSVNFQPAFWKLALVSAMNFLMPSRCSAGSNWATSSAALSITFMASSFLPAPKSARAW